MRIVTGGTMTAGHDYVPPPPIFVIPAGKVEAELPIHLVDDDLSGGWETLEVSAAPSPPHDFRLPPGGGR